MEESKASVDSRTNSNNSNRFEDVFSFLQQSDTYESIEDAKQKSNLAVQANASRYVILVNERQKGNTILKHIRNVPYEFNKDILPDYIVGSSSCALFLSVRFHMLNKHYISKRMEVISNEYRVRILLCYVDTTDVESTLTDINLLAIKGKFTLILAWSWEEAGRYIETLKAYENKSAALIKERIDEDYMSKLNDVLTTVRSVNKTDVSTLASTYGSLKNIMNASLESLVMCPGLGDKKVRNLWEAFHEPFQIKK